MMAMMMAASAILVVTLWGCQSSTPTPTAPRMALRQLQREPVVRIRLASAAQQIRIGGSSKLSVKDHIGRVWLIDMAVVANWSATDTSIKIDGDRITLPDPAVFNATDGTVIRAGKKSYPGAIVLKVRADRRGFDVINHVRLEHYLPGVLDRELYSHWHPQTYQSQAVAARSYAAANLARSKGRHFDLESTQASQVYSGTTGNRKALRAVRVTHGMVLTYDNMVVPAYYSSCSGGAGQDAVVAFPDTTDIAPLRGRDHGVWGQNCPLFRWGPINRNRTLLSHRLAAWGRHNAHSIRDLKDIDWIKISARNSVQRPTKFQVKCAQGNVYELGPELFRYAANFRGPGAPPLSAKVKLPSSYVTTVTDGKQVQFVDGHGFGHGVGLDQFGAEAMARRGHTAPAILSFYYPQSQLVQAY